MSDSPKNLQRLPNVVERKETVIEQLKEAFSAGYLVLDDYESRVSAAENTFDLAELSSLIADLPKTEFLDTITDHESVNCNMSTKKLAGSVLKTRRLNIEASMSKVTIDYLETEPIRGVQEISVNMNMSTLILYLPDDAVVENRIQENMTKFKENRNKHDNPAKPKTLIKITGTAGMSTIKIKRKKYWFFSKKK